MLQGGAARRERALVSCDVPFGPVQEGVDSALRAAIRLVKEGGADMVKVDAAADFPEAVKALTRAGIPVFAQFGLTPQTALKYGIAYSAQNSPGAQATAEATAKLVEEAKMLEDAGAVALDFTNSGPVAGAAVVKAVKIPVIGGFGGGPWLDGRVRMAHTAIGYAERWIDSKTDTYFNGAKATLAAFTALIDDARVRAVRSRAEHGNRNHRRDHHALRGDGLGPAAPDVRAGGLRRDAREVVDAGRLRQDQAARSSAEALHLHRVRSARMRPIRRPRRAHDLGALRGAGQGTARSSRLSSARTSWAAAWAAARSRPSACCIPRRC